MLHSALSKIGIDQGFLKYGSNDRMIWLLGFQWMQ